MMAPDSVQTSGQVGTLTVARGWPIIPGPPKTHHEASIGVQLRYTRPT